MRLAGPDGSFHRALAGHVEPALRHGPVDWIGHLSEGLATSEHVASIAAYHVDIALATVGEGLTSTCAGLVPTQHDG
jgi:hypothetical protein